jgi:hypothetical protein
MLDFCELPIDGMAFELLIRELLTKIVSRVFWSGRGPDGGRDLLAEESHKGIFATTTNRWLIQCKHNAHSGGGVGIRDLDNIVDSCNQHNATGYVLMCSTYPSSAVVNRLEAITSNRANSITATFWDAAKIEQVLSTPSTWPIAQRFLPKSGNIGGWKLHATRNSYYWIANYRGYYFHLSNRVGSQSEPHLPSIADRVSDIESIKLPRRHMMRLRSVYFDDLHGHYTWFLDYLYPDSAKPKYSPTQLKNLLGEDVAKDDGYFYKFNIRSQDYFPSSDHFDKDHDDYYNTNLMGYGY